jgi:mono/diheme cytochrome c family protein/peroxiredoxin
MMTRMSRAMAVLLVVPMLFAGQAMALAPGDRVDNFLLLDHRGEAHELHYLSDMRAVVVMVQGNGCPIVRNQLPRLAEIRDAYAERGVAFLLINSNLQDDRDTIREEAARFGIDFPILVDEAQLVGESMGFERTAEVFVIVPAERWRLAYRGPVDDRVSYARQRPAATNDYLVDALDAVLAGEPVPVASAPAEGCLINFPSRRESSASISYAETIAPMLVDNCVACHRPGGIGPFALTDYNVVHGFAPMIREVVRTQRMPPWHADPHYGQFENQLGLTIEEQQNLVRWIEAGAPRGDGPDPLIAAMEQSWPEWPLGEPDLVVELPPFDVPPTGVIPYLHPRVDNPLDRDVWVRAVDFIPGDRAVVHHIIAGHTYQRDDHRAEGLLGEGLAGYVPGAVPTVFPEETGVLLRNDAQFILQMHYTTSGKATTDVTRMGLYFHDQPPRYERQNAVLINPRFRIPPHAKRHTESAQRIFERPVVIYSLLPHAHYRGRSTEFRVTYPDGGEEVLLSVPNYDFNWQHTYILAEPKRLPAGSRLVHTTTWDNSAQNRANPDPTVEVGWGLQSWDEMLFGAVTFRYDDEDAAAGTHSDARVPRSRGTPGDVVDRR